MTSFCDSWSPVMLGYGAETWTTIGELQSLIFIKKRNNYKNKSFRKDGLRYLQEVQRFF